MKVSYSWSVAPGNKGQAMVWVKGYNKKGQGYWVYTGAGTRGSGRVLWGANIDYKRIKVRAVPPFGVTVLFN